MSLAKTLSVVFTGAGTVTLPGGRFFRILSSSSAVDVEFFDDSGQSLGKAESMLDGFGFGVEPADLGKVSRLIGFGKVQITSAAAQTVVVAISRQPIDYDRLAGSVTTVVTVGATVVASSVTAGAASGALLAANTDRRRAHITNTSATETVYIDSDAGAATTADFPIEPGETIIVQSTDGINVIRGGTVDANVRVLEERN